MNEIMILLTLFCGFLIYLLIVAEKNYNRMFKMWVGKLEEIKRIKAVARFRGCDLEDVKTYEELEEERK